MRAPWLPQALFDATPEFVEEGPWLAQTIPARIASVAIRWPRQVAVRGDASSLSYDGLIDDANSIGAAIVARLGEGSEPVAVAVDDSAALVLAFVGVLCSGKFFTPIGGELPPGRIADLLAHSQARAVVVDDHGAARLAGCLPGGVTLLPLDELRAARSDRPPVPVDPDSPAWLLYTSGTTGRPKGVLQSHRHQLAHARSNINLWRFGPGDRIAALQSLAFPAAVASALQTLCSGSTLCAYDLRRQGLGGLAPWIAREGVTFLGLFPALLHRILDAGMPAGALGSVRMLRLTTEPATGEDVLLARSYLAPKAVVVNYLGASECGAIAALALGPDEEPPSGVLPVGHPIPGKELRLLDEAGRPIRDGEPGEIEVTSESLALGYWREPQLTGAAFMPSPRGPTWRAYRTGDRARWRDDGTLEFLGRLERRLKIDGQTVEPAEVEHALLAISSVKEAAVVPRPGRDGRDRLIAFVRVGPECRWTSDQLRAALAQRLPSSHVPVRIVVADSLPRNSRGKVSLEELLETPEPPSVELARDPLEADLRQAFAGILDTPDLGLEDDFFATGGGSLQALALLSEVGRRAGVQLTLAELLAAPTPRALAALIKGGNDDRRRRLVAIRPTGSPPPLFCVHDGSGEVFWVRMITTHLRRARPVWGLRSPYVDGYSGAFEPVAQMAVHCVELMRTVQPGGPYFVAGYSFGGLLALAIAQELRAQGDDVGLLALLDTHATWTAVGRAGRVGARETGAAELKRHLQSLRQGTLRDRASYVWERLRQRAQLARFALLLPLWASAIRRGRPAPAALRSEHFVRAHTALARTFLPTPYDGRALIVAPAGATRKLRVEWRDLLVGQVAVEEVAGVHRTLIHPPAVDRVGQLLERHLTLAEGVVAGVAAPALP